MRNRQPGAASNRYNLAEMPLKLARLLIAFALALTIPLQALAAVTAELCMAMAHHQADMSTAHSHGPGHAHDDGGMAGQHDPDSDPSTDNAHCAPCVAAHIAPAAHSFIPDSSPTAAIAALPSLPPGFLPEKLDRPPLAL